LLPVIFISPLFSFTYSLFTDLLAQKDLFLLESSCLTIVSSSICKSPLSIVCSVGLVTHSFSFSLLWKVLISPSSNSEPKAHAHGIGAKTDRKTSGSE
jgi:hypothetical protein